MRTNRRRAGAVLVAAALTAGLTSGAASGTATAVGAGETDSAEVSGPKTRPARGAGPVVTLITGDQVHTDAGGRVTRVRGAEGREGVRMSVRRVGKDTYAVPSDAAKLVAEGRLDRRLFNVTGLIRDKYDDA
ncbi:1,4-dihydropyridine esterase, partial [Streptomyces sp. NPDC088124]